MRRSTRPRYGLTRRSSVAALVVLSLAIVSPAHAVSPYPDGVAVTSSITLTPDESFGPVEISVWNTTSQDLMGFAVPATLSTRAPQEMTLTTGWFDGHRWYLPLLGPGAAATLRYLPR